MKQLNLICYLIPFLLLFSCDKDEPQPPQTEQEMVVGHWERDSFRREVFDANSEFDYKEGPFDAEFTMILTEDEYTLSSYGHVERGTYDFRNDQDTRYLQLEAVTDIMSRTYYIDSISRSNLNFHYKVDRYSYSSGEPVYNGYAIYYEYYKKRK